MIVIVWMLLIKVCDFSEGRCSEEDDLFERYAFQLLSQWTFTSLHNIYPFKRYDLCHPNLSIFLLPDIEAPIFKVVIQLIITDEELQQCIINLSLFFPVFKLLLIYQLLQNYYCYCTNYLLADEYVLYYEIDKMKLFEREMLLLVKVGYFAENGSSERRIWN